jgi:peptide/nickel transport system substrate-binding protein
MYDPLGGRVASQAFAGGEHMAEHPGYRRAALGAAVALVAAAALFALVQLARSEQAVASSPSPNAERVTLRLGWNEGPLNLNPFIGYSASYEIWMLNYDVLVGIGSDGLPSKETGLAQSWETSADGKTWVFHLRSGVQWQDGEPLTARDVAFTFNYIIKNEMSNAVYLRGVDKAVAVDDTTLKVVCSRPKANMLLTQVYIYVLPEHIWSKIDPKAAANTYRNSPPIVGSGPFQMVEFKKDDYVKMVRNVLYWGPKPAVDDLIFQFYTNTDTMVQDLKSGAVDGAQVIPPAQFKTLESDPAIKAIAYPLYNWEYIDVNCYDSPDSMGNPVLRDVRFRRAMAWAVDRQKCADLGWGGRADPGYGIYPKQGWPASFDPYYQPTTEETIGFDLEKAKQMMDEAGYRDANGDGIRDYKGKPIKLRLWTRDISPESQIQGKLIAGWLRQIGLQIELTVVDEGALGDSLWNYKGDTYAPDYDLALWDFMGYIDPGDSAACFTTDQIENYNEMNWSNAEYDKLCAQQYEEMDPQKRIEILKRMQQIMYSEQPMIVLDYPSVLQAVNTTRWDGWAPYVGGSVWDNMISRESYISIRPKVAAATTDQGSSSATTWIVMAVAAALAIAVVAWLVRRRRGRALEE